MRTAIALGLLAVALLLLHGGHPWVGLAAIVIAMVVWEGGGEDDLCECGHRREHHAAGFALDPCRERECGCVDFELARTGRELRRRLQGP